jgi:hypothetical protein
VKVLHPHIKSRFLRDLTVLRSIVNSISWLFPQLRWLSIKESLEEFAKLMNIQVDLQNEAENLLKFHHNFKVIHLFGRFFFYSHSSRGGAGHSAPIWRLRWRFWMQSVKVATKNLTFLK